MVHIRVEVRKANLTKLIGVRMERIGWIWKFPRRQGQSKQEPKDSIKTWCVKRNVMGFIQISQGDSMSY